MLNLAHFAVHLFWRADDVCPCGLADGLVAQADAEQGEGVLLGPRVQYLGKSLLHRAS